jgi:hypothetical protein
MDLNDFLEDDSELLPAEVRKQAHTKTASFLPGRDEIGDDIHWGDTGAIDHVLQGRSIGGVEASSLKALTDKAKKADALQLPVKAGARVTFAHNLGSVLSYSDIPDIGVEGTVVTVRSADGDVTAYNDKVHVMWDDGTFRAISAAHLRAAKSNRRQASSVRIALGSLGDLSSFFEAARTGSSSDLVHKATKDLWSCSEADGGFVIERLFTEDGNPLKV